MQSFNRKKEREREREIKEKGMEVFVKKKKW